MMLALPSNYAPAAPAQTPAPVVHTAPVVVQSVTITPIAARSDLLVAESDWSWEELRDYVVSQIETLFGPFPRDSRKEFGIFSRFHKEHGAHAVAVAKYAFEIQGGWWQGAPVSVNRFCKGSDPYFAQPIIERLTDNP